MTTLTHGGWARSATAAAAAGRLYDPVVLFVCGALMVLGVATVYSASASVTGAPFDWRHWWHSPLRQGAYVVLGFLGMLAAAHTNYRWLAWERPWGAWGYGVLYAVALGLLVAMLIPGVGRDENGAQRSLAIPGLGGLGFQPAEIAKLVLVLGLAGMLSRPLRRAREGRYPVLATGRAEPAARGDVRNFRTGLAPIALGAGLLIGLTAIEDFGTAALMGAVLLGVLIAAGARWVHLGLLGVCGLAAGAAFLVTEPYRVERVRTYVLGLLGQVDAEGAGYQVRQGLLAIGSGGWWGRGLGAGLQKYGYVPKDTNDFILAIICEELGVVGGIAVISLFLVLLWRGGRIALAAPDRFGRLLALGLTLTICLQAAFNVAVVTNSVPTKGISLPFVSAGGSGVLLLGVAAGLLASIGRDTGTRVQRGDRGG